MGHGQGAQGPGQDPAGGARETVAEEHIMRAPEDESFEDEEDEEEEEGEFENDGFDEIEEDDDEDD